MYFSCQITKRELDPGATDASEVHDSLNENASRVMSLCMCLDMFKYAWSILKKREVIITKIMLCVLLLFSLLNCLPLNKIKLLDDSRLTFVEHYYPTIFVIL